MKRALMLIATVLIASTSVSGENLDSLVLTRMYGFRKSLGDSLEPFTTNVYMKHLYQTHRRNITLWTVPSLYTIADGKRAFVSEQYGIFDFRQKDYDYKRQVYYSTIPGQRNTMPVLREYITPDFYDVAIYHDHILSPFNHENKMFYRYSMEKKSDSLVTLSFRPRFIKNTQLVKGRATVELSTGRIATVEMEGEFDMIRFHTRSTLGTNGAHALFPRHSVTHVEFKFMGNHVSSNFETVFNCPVTLNDSIDVKGDRAMIDSLRPISLTDEERFVYSTNDYQSSGGGKTEEEASQDSTKLTEETPRHHNYLKEIGWDFIGGNLVRTLRAGNDNGYVKLSPILNPQYISFSRSKGISYKLKMGARYNFSPSTWIETNPSVGYNFKLHEFYWNVPIYLIYGPKMNAHLDISLGSDNRIGNNGVFDEIRKEYGDRPELQDKQLDVFDDHYIRIINVISPLEWFTLEAGLVCHQRRAINPEGMRLFNKPTEFRSLAPSVGVKIMPWKKGPMLSIDYERGLKGNDVNMEYERWEGDLSMTHNMSHLQTLNMRIGGGFYTTKGKNYFMDYSNFRDCNLPQGWDDDWTGNFQLLSSDLYNASNYYVRGNVSYESPLLGASMVPLLGRYVERERIYLNSLSIATTRFYTELGYGFTCRFASLAFFVSFLETYYQKFECKFTFELFRRW